MGDGEARVEFAFFVHALGEVAGASGEPIVVFAAVGEAELLPPFFGVRPLGVEEGPRAALFNHHAVVEVHWKRGGGLPGRASRVGGVGAAFGALGDVFDEGRELFVGPLEGGVVPLGGRGGLFVAAGAGFVSILDFALDLLDTRLRWSARSVWRVSARRWILIQATNVFFSLERGK